MKKTDYLFEKLLSEAKKLKDIDGIKTEINKLTDELKILSQPLNEKAKSKFKELEGKYSNISKTVGKVQEAVDKELGNAILCMNSLRNDAQKIFEQYREKAATAKVQGLKVAKEKVSQEIIKLSSLKIGDAQKMQMVKEKLDKLKIARQVIEKELSGLLKVKTSKRSTLRKTKGNAAKKVTRKSLPKSTARKVSAKRKLSQRKTGN